APRVRRGCERKRSARSEGRDAKVSSVARHLPEVLSAIAESRLVRPHSRNPHERSIRHEFGRMRSACPKAPRAHWRPNRRCRAGPVPCRNDARNALEAEQHTQSERKLVVPAVVIRRVPEEEALVKVVSKAHLEHVLRI